MKISENLINFAIKAALGWDLGPFELAEKYADLIKTNSYKKGDFINES